LNAGYISNGDPETMIDECVQRLQSGGTMIIFPEGTRSKTHELLPFKDGAFRLAIETGADILPMAVAGTETALRKHDWKLRYARAVVTVGRPIPTHGLTLDDVEILKSLAREQIEALRHRILPLVTASR
ncbi:MAG: lysophospholipid acyltransferase family protein, partial [Bradymonadaceae bacterium]